MDIESIKERFRGREAWRSINNGIIFTIELTVILCAFLFPEYLIWYGIGLAIVIPTYGYFFRGHLMEMQKRKKSNKVVEGWITHGYGIGEKIHFYPLKFQLSDKLSKANLESVNNFIALLGEMVEIDKKEIGLDRFKRKQLPLKEIKEKDGKDEAELKAIGKNLQEEFEQLKQELKERKEWEKEKLTQNIEKETKETEEQYKMNQSKEGIEEKPKETDEYDKNLIQQYKKETGKRVFYFNKPSKEFINWVEDLKKKEINNKQKITIEKGELKNGKEE